MREIARIAINGRFLAQPMTGVQRFAREMTLALDRRIDAGDVPATLKKTRWRLIVPRETRIDLVLGAIAVDGYGGGPGHLWEQTALASRARRDVLVGFGNSGPILHRRQAIVLHDATIFRHPDSFGLPYRLFHSMLGNVLTRTATIATVSAFSRAELSAIFHLPPEAIAVVHNAVDHFAALEPEETILKTLALEGVPYFLVVGTLKPNKNVGLVLEAFAKLGGPGKLVVVGGTDPKVFKSIVSGGDPNIVFPGRLADRAIAALHRHATAFVFPSLYEGFGIPPLEAMSQDCPVLAADIPAVREACGDGALYFDPRDVTSLVERMASVREDAALRADLRERGRLNITRFSWDLSAAKLLSVLAAL